MNKKLTTLQDRSILEISGEDRKKFIQGLITNDINKADAQNLIYSAMLNAQGRFLYDFFIFEKDEKLMIDCLQSRCDEIFTKLNFYKLRAKVTIKKNDEYLVASSLEPLEGALSFNDPRHENLGKRIYLAKNFDGNSKESDYHYRRISLKIAESEYDLTYEKSLILEFNFDNLNAIDYKKGCYIGQELTARTHYTGQIRKKIFHIKIANLEKIEKNCEISCEGKSIGLVLSSVFYENELHALALIKISEEENSSSLDSRHLTAAENKIFILG